MLKRIISLSYIILTLNIFANDFQDGNLEFSNKNYQEAEIHYLNDLENNGEDLNTLYNLAQVYVKKNEPGKALYYFYKTKFISPLDKVISKEIEELEKELEVKNQFIYINPLSYSATNLILSIFLFFLTLILLLVTIMFYMNLKENILYRNKKLVFSIFIFLTLIPVTLKEITKQNENYVINLKNSEIYLSPYEGSDISYNLSEGKKVRVKDEFNNYLYIIDDQDQYGWVKKDNIGYLWKN